MGFLLRPECSRQAHLLVSIVNLSNYLESRGKSTAANQLKLSMEVQLSYVSLTATIAAVTWALMECEFSW